MLLTVREYRRQYPWKFILIMGVYRAMYIKLEQSKALITPIRCLIGLYDKIFVRTATWVSFHIYSHCCAVTLVILLQLFIPEPAIHVSLAHDFRKVLC